MLTALSALLPIALYLLLLRTFDAFSMVRWRAMLAWMWWGMASCVLMYGQVLLARWYGFEWRASWISPVFEELLKAIPLLWLVWRRRFVFLAETQLLGQTIGAGFGLLENLLYLSSYPGMTVATALVRGMGTTLLHMGCTALCTSLLLFLLQHFGTADQPSRIPSRRVLLMPLVPLPSIVLHTLYNTVALQPVTLMVALIVIFFLLFYGISLMNERCIIRWLDVSLCDDVQLISALREGRLQQTRAGQYLIQLRERFEPLVFFDLCVYMQLYLELLVAAKARIMLRDAGLPHALTSLQRQQRRQQLAELNTLQQCIPRVGLLLLRPLIHGTDQDRWALRQY